MAIIHIITPEYLPRRGGVGDYTRAVARGLAAAGDDVHVWCGSDGRADPSDRFTVHADFGHFGPEDLRRAGDALDRFPTPRRIVVQWVPHGYGYRAMNLRFCFWLWQRASRGDQVEIVVHEAFLAFLEGTWRQSAAAVVHRVMTIVLLRAATRVWVSIPSWEALWKPYALGRAVPFEWLPIPSNLSEPDRAAVSAVRARFTMESKPIVGHLGTYGSLIAPLLSDALVDLLGGSTPPQILLLGMGAEAFAVTFKAQHPALAGAIHAAPVLEDVDLAAHVAACDVMLQPYPDGISSRRTSTMAALALGVPVVTSAGRLSEPVWADAVRLTRVGDHREMADRTLELLSCPDARAQLREAGRALYLRRFDLGRIVDELRRVDTRRAA